MKTTAPKGSVADVPVAAIAVRTGKTANPRKTFDKAAMAELADSIRRHGILQPILVRTNKGKGGAYELVAGERRLRASKVAGLKTIPAFVRELDDREVLEIQVIENLQREDLDPVEEANGYRRLLKDYGYQAEEIAERIGKSKAYVYARMKLAELPADARALLQDGRLSASTALLVARIADPVAAVAAAKEIAGATVHGKPARGDAREPLSFRDAKRYIADEVLVSLKGAPFPTTDAALVAKAGACQTCPKRSGNQPDLFGERSGVDVCTDPSCFRAKCTAELARRVARGAERGDRAASKAELGRMIIQGRYQSWTLPGGLLDLSHRNYQDPRSRHWNALLGKDCPPRVLLQDPESGAIVELVNLKDAEKVVREKFPRWGKPATKARTSSPAEARRKLDAAVRIGAARAAMKTIVDSTEAKARRATFTAKSPAFSALLRPVVSALIEATWSETVKAVVARRCLDEVPLPKGQRFTGSSSAPGTLRAYAEHATGAELLGVLVELVATRAESQSEYGSSVKDWKALAAVCGVDPAALRRAARSRLTAELAAKKSKAKASKKKKTSRKAKKRASR